MKPTFHIENLENTDFHKKCQSNFYSGFCVVLNRSSLQLLTFVFFVLSVAVTSHPSNESELQIYRVLQRANLLSYYDTFIAQGE